MMGAASKLPSELNIDFSESRSLLPNHVGPDSLNHVHDLIAEDEGA